MVHEILLDLYPFRLLTGNPYPLGYSTLESAMNIELDEVVVQDVSDDALEMAAGGAQAGYTQDVFMCSGVCGVG
jgi:hypothetical protein